MTYIRLFSVLLLTAGACIVPSRAPPRVSHPTYPMGAIDVGRSHARGLYVGAAKIDITPPDGAAVWLAGYGFQRKMSAVQDRIWATAIYFDDGQRRVAVVVADVVGLFLTTTERVRRLVGPDIDVVVASTHNHQSPDTMGYWGPAILYAVPVKSGIDPAYLEVMERRLAVAVKRAAESARPASLFAARADLPEGLVKNLREPGVYDRAIELVEARTRDGDVIATFLNFGCHPESLGDRATVLSADFPGVLRARVEEERGGVAVFANGVLGGMITPHLETDAGHRERQAFARRLGEESAALAVKALATAERIDVDHVRSLRKSMTLPVENDLFRYIARVGLVEPRPRAAEDAFVTEIDLVTIGPLAWVTVPGEPSPAVGAGLKAALVRAGFVHPVVIALGNDELGYLLTPEQFDDDRYAYEASVSPGRGAGTAVIESLEALILERAAPK